MNWWQDLRGRVRFKEPLKEHTTFRIGGPAQFFIEPKDIADLKLLLCCVRKYRIPLWILGAGSNILVSDKGVEGVVLKLNSPFFRKISNKRNHFKVGAFVALSKLIQEAGKLGYSGMEFLAGIPGTIGGALAMNVGVGDKNIGDLVKGARVMDYRGKIKSMDKDEIKFAYRRSNLEKFIILGADLELVKKNRGEFRRILKRYLDYRRNTQDKGLSNAGCVFKNPPQEPAGRLIDLCGLKGKRIGGAYVSKRHANFIVNAGDARANDVLKLMDLIKKRVKGRFRVNLEPEIKIWQ